MAQRKLAYEQLGEVLFEARKDAQLSLRELGLRLDRPHSYIAKTESGARSLSVIEFVELARALGIDPAKLLAKVIKATGL